MSLFVAIWLCLLYWKFDCENAICPDMTISFFFVVYVLFLASSLFFVVFICLLLVQIPLNILVTVCLFVTHPMHAPALV